MAPGRRARELREARGDDPAAVEADRRAERALRGDEERDAAAEAEADDADLAVGEAEAAQVAERRVDVGHDRLVVPDPDEVLDHRAEVSVVDDRAAGAVEHVGCDGVVAGRGHAAGDVFDVRIDAEGLLDDDDRAARLAVGDGFVAAHLTVGRADDLVSRPHDSEPKRLALPCGRSS